MMSISEILKGLGLTAINAGGSTGAHWWASGTNTVLLDSVNPATGETIAQIRACSADDYEHIVRESIAAFQQWRLVPAPKRGELVRLIGARCGSRRTCLARWCL
jgi:NAD-dependent aldehyde dehydrogenases